MTAHTDIEARLANALGRRDEAPNIALAEDIAGSGDKTAVAALVGILDDGKQSARSDAIKVLYEIGDRNPELIAPHADRFLEHMTAKNNRVVWGCLTALSCIAPVDPETIFRRLDDILAAADTGSVIAKDQAINILVTLATDPSDAVAVMPVIIARLRTSAVNQLPVYAEKVLPIVPDAQAPAVRDVLASRLGDDIADSKRKRLNAVLKKLPARS